MLRKNLILGEVITEGKCATVCYPETISLRQVSLQYETYTRETNRNNKEKISSIWEIQTVKEAFAKYSVSAFTLMKLIERDYGKRNN